MSGGASLSIGKLNKENYDTWKLQMEAILIKDDLWEYANASLRNKKDGKARIDIILTMSSSELCHVKHCKPSHELWYKLKEVYDLQVVKEVKDLQESAIKVFRLRTV
ncbi:uncharacterized protein LOC105681057 [Bombus impatiens]|uniref:Uncharacterized protein LOC105681057 n=1 Tax=Bombus impatiens TaxID=132113 RepID=A0A6P6FFD9_BOMIM|nr:uncharacterized protein LOC105681057 [Bombus impatiens]